MSPGSEQTGRPRDPVIDRAIIAAALEEVAELGYAAATMAGIARRAAVPKSTVYRRWESKQDLVVEAMGHVGPARHWTWSGDARADLLGQMTDLVARWQDPESAAVMLSLITEVSRSPELFAVWDERVLAPFRRRVAAVLSHGIETGQLRDDVDVGLVAEMMLALPLHIALAPHPDLDAVAERFLSSIVDGIATTTERATAPIPPGGTTPLQKLL